ncbi:hypothetical protein JEJ96_01380 [Klebsiella pneumoniae]|uniref:hypothetical protein n=1 Tax=Klebsiella TaxID=570 RepID=UPI00164AEBD5|nr:MULTISPECIES: hypothetical protein [Klebsiella]MBC4396877.1 hypothetical protein [Klebsiella pneumoniae]MCQ8574949.1 hypothetical protein [Klebsiella pneumoniae]UYH05576.1 hypothetical protein NQA44_03785 [Klebsiella oxytoca]HBS5876184.1 hypothetical protein [Klebsiella pneumoniae]HDW1391256.1 hypothetical protein [Klebsiella oxytoca]
MKEWFNIFIYIVFFYFSLGNAISTQQRLLAIKVSCALKFLTLFLIIASVFCLRFLDVREFYMKGVSELFNSYNTISMNFLLYMSIILGWVILPFGLGNSSAKETINVLTIEGSPKNKRLKKKYICMLGMSLVIILLFQNVLNSFISILFYYICALDKLKLIYFVKPEINLIAFTFSMAGILGYKILQGSLLKEYDSLDNGL